MNLLQIQHLSELTALYQAAKLNGMQISDLI